MLLFGCQGDSRDDVTDRLRLDPCRVQVEPPMKPEVERFTYPAKLAQSLSLDVNIDESGLTISGLSSNSNSTCCQHLIFTATLLLIIY